MTYRGHIQNGAVVIEGAPQLPEGAMVNVEVVEEPRETLGQHLMKIAGIAEGLPTDMAENHDHYIHGTSKRK